MRDFASGLSEWFGRCDFFSNTGCGGGISLWRKPICFSGGLTFSELWACLWNRIWLWALRVDEERLIMYFMIESLSYWKLLTILYVLE